MPRTKREGIFYGAVMAFTMSLFMNLFNTFFARMSLKILRSYRKDSELIAEDL